MDKIMLYLMERRRYVLFASGFILITIIPLLMKLEQLSSLVAYCMASFAALALSHNLGVQPRPSRQSDPVWAYLTRDQAIEAMNYAYNIMMETGWKPTDYVKHRKDCEDFADVMKVHMREWVDKNTPREEKGIPIDQVRCITNKMGPHAIIEVGIGPKESMFIEVYPFEGELKLEAREIASRYWDNGFKS